MDIARKNEALFVILEALRPTHYLAVITTGSRQNATEMLDHFHCTDWFDLILTQEDVVNNKPDPEGYLKAMAHFGVDAAHTMIFEDSAPALPPPAPPEPACLRAISSDPFEHLIYKTSYRISYSCEMIRWEVFLHARMIEIDNVMHYNEEKRRM